MLKISRLTDYACQLLQLMAQHACVASSENKLLSTNKSTIDGYISATQIAEQSRVNLPTVRKIMKQLSAGDIVVAQLGANGGYSLSRPPKEISLAQILQVMEPASSLTDCGDKDDCCTQASTCGMRSHWKQINSKFYKMMADINLDYLSQIPGENSQIASCNNIGDNNMDNSEFPLNYHANTGLQAPVSNNQLIVKEN